MHLHRSDVLAALLLLPVTVRGATYRAIKEYSGPTFFNDWDYYGRHDDLTNGDVNYVTAEQGTSGRLTYVDPTTNRAIIKVDNATFVPYNEKRNTVRITTKDSFEMGSLWIADMRHIPYGCSAWPSWWSWSPATGWPQGGEIDTMEGVNLAPSAQMALHTTAGCQQTNPEQISTLINGTNCASGPGAGHGCVTTNSDPAAFGQAFARAGGGVYITEFAETGISMWFFSRDQIPESVTAEAISLDTETLGRPMANWPSSGCDIATHFQPQNLVFTITLCGDFAGTPTVFDQTCSGVCYRDFVMSENFASIYSNAYFDVSYVKVFSSNPDAPTLPSGSSPTTEPTGSNTQDGASADPTNGSTSTKAGSLMGISALALGVAALL